MIPESTEPVVGDIQERLFGEMTESQLRAELEKYRHRWRFGQVSWRVLKSAEKMLKGELRFRKLLADASPIANP